MATPTFENELYHIKSGTLFQVLETLESHTCSEDGEYNNDDVIATCDLLEKEMEKQEARKENPLCVE